MLAPQDRCQLFNILRPPDGYSLDYAIGTTYSLDLLTLLTVPLAFTFFDTGDARDVLENDPLIIVEAVRRNAGKIAIFCQAGGIHVPESSANRPLSFVESAVVEVKPPDPAGVFHPKVWLLRFAAKEGPVKYRFLCLTRNLTFDRSWDTALVLDGDLLEREKAIARNHPLGDFIQSLPGMAIRPVKNEILKEVERLQYEVRRVNFSPSDGFDEVMFLPMGIGDKSKDPLEFEPKSVLVMAPFLSGNVLRKISVPGMESILVSKSESLDKLPKSALDGYEKIYVLNEGATPEDEDPQDGADSGIFDFDEDAAGKGLHAKLFIFELGRITLVMTGSANATYAAFNHNVEFLTGLVGRKSRFGIESLLGSDEKPGLQKLFSEYAPAESKIEENKSQVEWEKAARIWRSRIAQADLRARVSPAAEGGDYEIRIYCPKKLDWAGAIPFDTFCRPVTVSDSTNKKADWHAPEICEFSPLSLDAVTSFFAFSVQVEVPGKKGACCFVLNLPLENAPKGRNEWVLRKFISDQEQFLRLLRLILYEGPADIGSMFAGWLPRKSWGETPISSSAADSLLELLLETLAKNPQKIVELEDLVSDLTKNGEMADCLPEGFAEIWEPIRRIAEKNSHDSQNQ